MRERIAIIDDDLTRQSVDAIVNAANTSLLGGGGVDGAIHRAAGPELLAECRTLNGCPTGEAKITKGYRLPAKFVIHTVGPIWRGGHASEKELLQKCYRNSLQIAVTHEIKTIAFPSISTGTYNYPTKEASTVALKTIKDFLIENIIKIKVFFVLYSQRTFDIYLNTANEIMKKYNLEPI